MIGVEVLHHPAMRFLDLGPAGTGFEYYQRVRIEPDEPPPPPPPSPEELELEREMEYFVEPEDPISALNRTLGQTGGASLASAEPGGAETDG